MNVLSIGNSFSQDAHRYLHQIARADGVEVNAFNLYIGGCSLSRHYRNMLSQGREYTLEVNGSNTGFRVSLKEALLNRDWDVVTVQQVSQSAPDYESYQPYLDELIAYVKACAPKAKIALHQTWAYEQDSCRLREVAGYADCRDMLRDIISANRAAAEHVGADCLIPSGELFSALLEQGAEKIHRDTFHASLGLGRYALGLLWYRTLTGCAVGGNTFCDFDEPIAAEQIENVKICVEKIAAKYGA
ncbi:MAG: DUF4886 domain-containing protein [Oscillospiraceae bacterium]|nr:DUF4886 domain-containing protein [Oscillospiraceae bacterium]